MVLKADATSVWAEPVGQVPPRMPFQGNVAPDSDCCTFPRMRHRGENRLDSRMVGPDLLGPRRWLALGLVPLLWVSAGCLGSRPTDGNGDQPGGATGSGGGGPGGGGMVGGAGGGGKIDGGTDAGGIAGRMADAGSDVNKGTAGAGGAAGTSGGIGGAGMVGTGAGGTGVGGKGTGGTGIGGTGIGGTGVGGRAMDAGTIDTAPPPRPASLTANNLTIDLGTIEAGVTTPTSVKITNNGDAPLARIPTVTSSAPAELIISNNGCTTALAGGISCNIALGFNPAAVELRSQTLSVSDGTTSVTVTVSAIGARRLTVATTGGGSGTVTSTPAGIQCGATCSFLAGQDGTMVTLHAQTTNGSGALFTGWNGGGCTGIVRDCTVTLLAATTVTATFTPVTANLVFVTSASFAPNRGSAAAYDSVCNTAATAAGINDPAGGAFTAVTSDATTTVRSRLGASANGWVRMDGEPFADTQATLFVPSGPKIFNPVRFDELGQNSPGNGFFSLTGTNGDGSASTSTCNNWTSASAALSVSGGLASSGPGWLTSGSLACTNSPIASILCMGHTHNVTVSPHVVAGRKIWLNNDFVNIVPGQSVDALCQASRPSGVTTAIALIAHPNKTAASLIDPTKTYVRVDGTLVGTGAQLQTTGDLASGIWQSGNGSYGLFAVWTGTTTMQTAGTTATTCGDWVDPTSTGQVAIGSGSSAAAQEWWIEAFVGCGGGAGLYCVQTAP